MIISALCDISNFRSLCVSNLLNIDIQPDFPFEGIRPWGSANPVSALCAVPAGGGWASERLPRTMIFAVWSPTLAGFSYFCKKKR